MYDRWGAELEALELAAPLLTGDAAVAAAFVAYAGPFPGSMRAELVAGAWVPDLLGREVPTSDGAAAWEGPPSAGSIPPEHDSIPPEHARTLSLCGEGDGLGGTSVRECADPLRLLGGVAGGAAAWRWRSEGLPHDRVSRENAAILEATSRHPLLIDPQRLGATWLRNKLTPLKLLSTRPLADDLLSVVRTALEQGRPLLLEDCSEKLPLSLAPVLSRSLCAKGRKLVLQLGDTEIDVLCAKDPLTGMPLLSRAGGGVSASAAALPFRLYAQTRLPNPHVGPELQAHLSLLDFAVTEAGLECTLLGALLTREAPGLEAGRLALREAQVYI